MARGALIFPFIFDIAQLDTEATAADPDVAGPLTSGYDDEFREPVIIPPASGSARGVSARKESIIQVRAQFEEGSFETQTMMLTGNSPRSIIKLVLHYQDLEDAGLVEIATGRPMLRINDRLVAVREIDNGALIETFPDPPGVYCIEVQSRSFGLGTHRNLLLMTFQQRSTSVLGTG
jgi:hypothetical protein